jgi:formate hydrogenlyase subunit 6/NADH:ubiquinone oxidoreductase subunit I
MGTKLAKMSLRNLFTKPVTKRYPTAPVVFPTGSKGVITNHFEDCILCSICAVKCPSDAITVDKPAGTWTIDPFACVQCFSCVRACPKKCLQMEAALPATALTKEPVVMQKPATEPDQAPAPEAQAA